MIGAWSSWLWPNHIDPCSIILISARSSWSVLDHRDQCLILLICARSYRSVPDLLDRCLVIFNPIMEIICYYHLLTILFLCNIRIYFNYYSQHIIIKCLPGCLMSLGIGSETSAFVNKLSRFVSSSFIAKSFEIFLRLYCSNLSRAY